MSKHIETKPVEELDEGDIVTFKQADKKLGQYRRFTHEKVTGTVVGAESTVVITVDRKGFPDSYEIPAGTPMRVHVKDEAPVYEGVEEDTEPVKA